MHVFNHTYQLLYLLCMFLAMPYQLLYLLCMFLATPYQLLYLLCMFLAMPYQLLYLLCMFLATPYQLLYLLCMFLATPYQLLYLFLFITMMCIAIIFSRNELSSCDWNGITISSSLVCESAPLGKQTKAMYLLCLQQTLQKEIPP